MIESHTDLMTIITGDSTSISVLRANVRKADL